MPVTYCRANLFEDEKELYSFLIHCQENLSPQDEPRIVSFAQSIEVIDPLAVLQSLLKPDQFHFYWENPSKDEAIAAYGATQYLATNSGDRFLEGKKFIHSCLKRVIRAGNHNLSNVQPYFFSTFTFFPKNSNDFGDFPSATIFLPHLQIIRQNNQSFLFVNFLIDKNTPVKLLVENFAQELQSINWSSRSLINSNHHQSLKYQFKSSDEFKEAVTSVLKFIATQKLRKIVLAHAIDVNLPKNFSLIESLHNLRKNHTDCYIFSTGNAEGSYFVGASPERLISIKKRQLVTDALAGSAPRGKNPTEDKYFSKQLLKSGKERREHQVVSEFIIERLASLGLKPQKAALQLLQLSNIQHLWTPIYAQLPKNVNPLDIVNLLHPTPAVAGVPTELAFQQIKLYEKFDRSLYAAPLGWIDFNGNSEFIVGIRSALIKDNKARLYAGAGIVAGSTPEQEFAEIQLKLQSLLKVLV
jgi:menaquinone-specific isochorismate synthase